MVFTKERGEQNGKNVALTERNLCAYLKARREELGKSQAEIAKALGYKNANFLSVLENGKVRLPFAKLTTIARAYEVEPYFLNVMVKTLYPEIWDMAWTMAKTGLFASTTQEEEDKELQAEWEDATKKVYMDVIDS